MRNFNHNKLATAAIAMLGVAFFATGANADQPNSLTVRYSDLNLGTAAGAQVLYQRIHSAAVKVCGDADARQWEQALAVKACRNQAIEKSVRAVNNMQLTHLANQQGLGARAGLIVASAE